MRGGRCYNATRAVWSIVLDLGYKVDPETGEFTCVDGPKGFATWQECLCDWPRNGRRRARWWRVGHARPPIRLGDTSIPGDRPHPGGGEAATECGNCGFWSSYGRRDRLGGADLRAPCGA